MSNSEPYSLQSAREFGWYSIGRELAPFRLDTLSGQLVGRRVLDAGCGGGGYVDHLVRRGYDATGVDRHAAILDIAAARGFAGRFVLADLAGQLPFRDDAFESTYCFDVLEHVDDVSALRELARVTSRRLILTVPQDDSPMRRYGFRSPCYLDPTHLRYYSRDMVQALAASVAPRAVRIEGECPTNIRAMAIHRLTARSRFPGVTPVYKAVLDFILTRTVADEFHWNFLVVIDL